MLPWLGPDYEVSEEVYRNVYRATCLGEPRLVAVIEDTDMRAPPLVAEHPNVVEITETYRHDDSVVVVIERFAAAGLTKLLSRACQARARAGSTLCSECDGELALTRCEPGVQALCEGCGGMFEWRDLPTASREALAAHLGPLWLEDAVMIGRAAAVAIEHFHKHPIERVPLDSHHIGIDETGAVKVLPPPLARLRRPRGRVIHPTLSYYIAPEVARGDRGSPASDVYSIAALLYELFTGRHPTCSSFVSDYALLTSFDNPVPPPSSLVDDFPIELELALAEGLAKDPGARPPLTEMRRSLDELTDARDLTLRPQNLAALASSLVRLDDTWLITRLP